MANPTSTAENKIAAGAIMLGYACIVVLVLCAGLSRPTAAQESAPATVTQTPTPTPNPNLPTLFVVGDSTANNHANGALGWGDPFVAYFDATKINVLNRARAGRSSRTFQTEGLWDKVLADMKPGDFVLIQFGHNDAGAINDESRARGSLPGTGEETQEIDNLLTKQHEVVHTYGWYMRKFIADTKAKGATPIVLSLTVRNIWKDGKVERGSGKFGPWAAEVAKAQGVTFVDLTTMIADRYEELGEEKVKPLFGPDHTHTSPAGAELNAALVVAGLKGLNGCPFCKYLAAKGEDIPAQVPTTSVKQRRPLPEPANPKLPTLFLIGDSTVRNGQGDGAGGQWGWGEPLGDYFDPNKLNVVNRAVGGLSSRTYLTGGHWDKVRAMLKPGDFVIMQFGHNDNGPLNDDSRARGTIKGTGAETQEIDNLLTKQHEVVHSYGWYLRKFIADTRAQGATPIVCSLVPRKIWKEGKIVRNAADYAGWAAGVAKAEHVAFIDLNNIIAAQYDQLGPEKVEPLFADPHTHTSRAGAELNAASVVAGLKALHHNPLAHYFSAKAKAVSKAKLNQS
jgi:lysophospholipase L1-like esterase